MTLANALDVSSTPLMAPSFNMAGSYTVNVMTSAVMLQTTTVSINGSSIATKPWVSGSWVRTAAWAIDDDPIPASLEKAARRKPSTKTAIRPPLTPSGLNAFVTIDTNAPGKPS